MKIIKGGITSPIGFRAAGIYCGIKAAELNKNDLTLIVSDKICSAAGVFTTNKVKASPVYLSQANIKDGKAIAIICNSGNANACAPKGEENALRMCVETAKILNVAPGDVLVASTGIIGYELNVDAIANSLPTAVKELSNSYEAGLNAADAIMTTDLVMKQVCVEIELAGKTVKVAGIAKGSGMIHPNMGTMLSFITTDAAVESSMLQKMLSECVKVTFNRISVDGDTSTNDTCCVLANGMAGNMEIIKEDKDYEVLKEALAFVCQTLAKKIAKDGEGATKLITCTVKGAESEKKAETIAMSVIKSPLVKTAMYGSDANWGRVLCSMGYAGVDFDPLKVTVAFASKAGKLDVCKNGKGLPFDEDIAKKILVEDEVVIDITMEEGTSEVSAWGCDLSYDYVKINGDYRN